MADLSSSAPLVANNPYSIPLDLAPMVGGLVQHALVSASTQIRILSIIDDTGSATVGDIIAELPDHPDPAGAIVVMIELGILCATVRGGIMDAHTIVRRCAPPPRSDNDSELERNSDALPTAATPATDPGSTGVGRPAGVDRSGGLTCLAMTPFAASVVVGRGDQRRGFMRMDELHRCGVYGLVSRDSIYIGMGSDVGQRIATGHQPIEEIETVFAVTDANDSLGVEDAKACERILWSRVHALSDRTPVNKLPDGGVVDAERYSQLDLFVSAACLALRQQELLFSRGSARSLVAGPRNEAGRLGPLRLPHEAPPGTLHELSFGNGLVALASCEASDRWLVLRGSDVRGAAVATAGAGPSFLRAAWMHAGLLEPAPDGLNYVATRDLVFHSASAAAVFVTGARGRGWVQHDPGRWRHACNGRVVAQVHGQVPGRPLPGRPRPPLLFLPLQLTAARDRSVRSVAREETMP